MTDSIPKLQKTWTRQLQRPLPKWHMNQGNTNDCGPYCATIVANGLRDSRVVDAPTLARSMEEAPKDLLIPLPFSLDRIKGWATFPWGVAHALEKLGFQVHWQPLATVERLKKNLEDNVTTIVIVGDPLNVVDGQWRGWAHYKVLYAWHPENGWAFVDPVAAAGEVYSYQGPQEFEAQWESMGRFVIEVR